jgi:hypothetical protein
MFLLAIGDPDNFSPPPPKKKQKSEENKIKLYRNGHPAGMKKKSKSNLNIFSFFLKKERISRLCNIRRILFIQ